MQKHAFLIICPFLVVSFLAVAFTWKMFAFAAALLLYRVFDFELSLLRCHPYPQDCFRNKFSTYLSLPWRFSAFIWFYTPDAASFVSVVVYFVIGGHPGSKFDFQLQYFRHLKYKKFIKCCIFQSIAICDSHVWTKCCGTFSYGFQVLPSKLW